MSGVRRRDCGACNLCCKVLQVPDIGKPSGIMCWWTTLHGGCAKQGEKGTDPKLAACAQFECVWLTSQRQPDDAHVMDRPLRPDQCHVVFGPPDHTRPRFLFVHVDPLYPDAWRQPAVHMVLENMVAKGWSIEIHVGGRNFMYMSDNVATFDITNHPTADPNSAPTHPPLSKDLRVTAAEGGESRGV